MRLSTLSTILFFSLSLRLPLSSAQSTSPPMTLECDNESLTTYLVSLLDLLYNNGLTMYEELLVKLAQTDEGYEKILDLFASPSITLLVPTDSAFNEAGLSFSQEIDSKKILEIFSLHALQGSWDKMGGNRGIASTLLTIQEGMGGSSSSPEDENKVYQAVVLQKSEQEWKLLNVRMAVGNSSSWNGAVGKQGHEVLNNLVVLPIEKVITPPPKLSEALTLPTSTRSPNGFPKFSKGITNDEMTELEKFHPGGFTIFAVVDDGYEGDWKGDAKAHYTTDYSLFSPAWSDHSVSELEMDSGGKLTFSQDGDGWFVGLSGSESKSRILRSDVVLQNGVLHIIEAPLTSNLSTSTNPSANTASELNPMNPSNSLTNGLNAESTIPSSTEKNLTSSGISTNNNKGQNDSSVSGNNATQTNSNGSMVTEVVSETGGSGSLRFVSGLGLGVSWEGIIGFGVVIILHWISTSM